MSLINQVLQDLEKRHASEPELKSLPPHVRAVPEAPSRTGARVAVLAVAAIAVAVIVTYFSDALNLRPTSDPPKPAVTAAAPPAAAPAPEPKPKPAAATAASDRAVQAVLLAPASRLSEELSFVPEAPVTRTETIPTRTAKPRAAKKAVEKEPPVSRDAAETTQAAAPISAPEPAVPQAVAPSAPPAEKPVVIDKQVREMTTQQRAELSFRKGVALLREGRAAAADASFRDALQEDQGHVAARQALLGLLLDAGRRDEAELLLRQALELNPRQPRHAMVLARLEVDRGDVNAAVNTLVGALPYVQSDPEYFAFLAALLQREGRHREAVDYYGVALQSAPGNALWTMGLGISLRAAGQVAEAREAFQRALQSKQLNPELQGFVERQLRELASPKKK